MAIDRPGAIDPHPKGRSTAKSSGRQLFCPARNGAQRQGKIVAERRCGQAIERAARPSARSAQQDATGRLTPDRRAKRSQRLRIAADDPHRAPHQTALTSRYVGRGALRDKKAAPLLPAARGRDPSRLRRPSVSRSQQQGHGSSMVAVGQRPAIEVTRAESPSIMLVVAGHHRWLPLATHHEQQPERELTGWAHSVR